MKNEELEQIIAVITKGDTQFAEALFAKPGGRKYLENIVLIVITTSPYLQQEKEALFSAFVKALNKIEKRIRHQKQGQQILKQVYD